MTVYTLTKKAKNVQTNSGVKQFPVGTKIGGNPSGLYIILDERREFETDQGTVTLEPGEKVHCEHNPGEPNPCDPA